jgi:hypothetical protein
VFARVQSGFSVFESDHSFGARGISENTSSTTTSEKESTTRKLYGTSGRPLNIILHHPDRERISVARTADVMKNIVQTVGRRFDAVVQQQGVLNDEQKTTFGLQHPVARIVGNEAFRSAHPHVKLPDRILPSSSTPQSSSTTDNNVVSNQLSNLVVAAQRGRGVFLQFALFVVQSVRSYLATQLDRSKVPVRRFFVCYVNSVAVFAVLFN